MDRYGEKIKQTKKTKYILDSPKKGFITKIYPLPTEDVKFPYMPAEHAIKKYSRFDNNVLKKIKKKTKKKFKKVRHKNIL